MTAKLAKFLKAPTKCKNGLLPRKSLADDTGTVCRPLLGPFSPFDGGCGAEFTMDVADCGGIFSPWGERWVGLENCAIAHHGLTAPAV